MKKLDKKQVPQFIALCVLTAGVSGYLVMHLVAPSQVSAGTRPPAAPTPVGGPAPAPGRPASAAAASGTGTTAVAAVPAATDAPPPTPAMHDPFAPGYVDPSTILAKNGAAPAAAPALPGLPVGHRQANGQRSWSHAGFVPLGSGSARQPQRLPVAWKRSDVRPARSARRACSAICSGGTGLDRHRSSARERTAKVAILRSGESRRIVRSGEFVDGMYRVTGVTRTSVTLRHGAASYQLVLGAAKAGPAAPGAAPGMPFTVPPAAPVSAPAPRPAAVIDGAIIPVYRSARPKAALAPLQRQDQALLAAETLSVPNPSPSAAQVAAEISRGLQMHGETAL